MTGYDDGVAALQAEQGPPPPSSRGVIALHEESCTSCMLCARECPDWCIEIDSHKETLPAGDGDPGSTSRRRVVHVLDRFAIDYGLCLWCGICIEVCPFDALFWSPSWEHAVTDSSGLVHERFDLRRWLVDAPGAPGNALP